MLKRFYADNFRCLTNFELKLDQANILLGANGTGKTSVLTALRRIQRLIVGGAKVDEVFPARDLTMIGHRKEQRFDIQYRSDDQTYDYG
ncbi:MAG: AAA family ATPase [Spirochaetaceae bacterium]|nr:AAA family ATPase [Spirochaetaceae bacterium]